MVLGANRVELWHLTKAEVKFSDVRVGDRVSIYMGGRRVYGHAIEKVTKDTALDSYIRVRFNGWFRFHEDDPLDYSPSLGEKTKKFSVGALRGYASFRVEQDGLTRAARRCYNRDGGKNEET